MKPKYDLLTKRRFLPLFLTQFFGAFNDNLLRNGLVVLVTYKIVARSSIGLDSGTFSALAAVLLIAPYILFSGIAGELADKYERSRLMRYTKFLEAIIMVLAAIGFWYNDIYILLGLLFLGGTQATFFSPMKYSVIPDHLHKDELITGNGFIEGGTYLAILIGSILGTQAGNLIEIGKPETTLYVSVTLLVAVAVGITASFFIPCAAAASPNIKINFNFFTSTVQILKIIYAQKPVYYAALGTAWFWGTGSVFMSQFPTFGREVLYANPNVYTIFLAVFSVGVAIGALASAKILKGEISGKYAPKALLGMTFFTVTMIIAAHFAFLPDASIIDADHVVRAGSLPPEKLAELKDFVYKSLLTPSQFFAHIANTLVVVSIFGISFCGGLYAIPLKTIIQDRSDEKSRSRVIAADNVIDAFFMVGFGIIVAILEQKLHVGVLAIFALVAIANIGYVIFIKSILKKIV